MEEVLKDLVDQLISFCESESLPVVVDLAGGSRLEELGISSMQFIKFVVRLEMHFDVDFDDESIEAAKFETVSDIARYIMEQLEAA